MIADNLLQTPIEAEQWPLLSAESRSIFMSQPNGQK